MERRNKNEAIASMHEARILEAAEGLFRESFEKTSISDISAASGYSRRTIYAYFTSKEDILRAIIAKGLDGLTERLEEALREPSFDTRFEAVCRAMTWYHRACPLSMRAVNDARTANIDFSHLTAAESRIFERGTQINTLLCRMIEEGQKSGDVRRDIVPMMSVYVLSGGITALLDLNETKGAFITRQFSVSEDEFLEYGFKQLKREITTHKEVQA